MPPRYHDEDGFFSDSSLFWWLVPLVVGAVYRWWWLVVVGTAAWWDCTYDEAWGWLPAFLLMVVMLTIGKPDWQPALVMAMLAIFLVRKRGKPRIVPF